MNNNIEIKSLNVTNVYSDKLHDVRWQKKRNSILMRDDYTCQCCGANDKFLHVHHIKYITNNGKFIEPWDYPDEMLTSLCEQCHEKVHEQAKIKEKVDKEANNTKEYFNILLERVNDPSCTKEDELKILRTYCEIISKTGSLLSKNLLKGLSKLNNQDAIDICKLAGELKKFIYRSIDLSHECTHFSMFDK